MFNSLLTFIKAKNNEGRRIENNLRTIKEKQRRHDSFTHLNHY